MAPTGSAWSVVSWATLAGAAAFTAWTMWSLPAVGAPPDRLPPDPPGAASGPQGLSRAAVGPQRSAIAGCEFDPLLPAATRVDGRFSVARTLFGGDAPRIDAFLAAARQESRRGRSRNAETALIAACRIAAARWPGHSMPLADAQRALADLYLAAASSSARDPQAVERARALLAESFAGYAAVLGAQASKTRRAAEQLAALALPESSAAIAATPAVEQSEDLAALGCVPRGESIACSDPELSQLGADLDRLSAQAASVTSDPEGFRLRAERAAASRDAACHDKACLVHWFARRRGELIAEFGRRPTEGGHSVAASR